MAALTVEKKWQRVIRWLRRNFRVHLPVQVRSVPASRVPKMLGCCSLNTDVEPLGRFEIRVNKQMSFALRCDTLIHEWAHAMTWFGAEYGEDHSDEWALCQGKIYRAFCEWNYDRRVPVSEE